MFGTQGIEVQIGSNTHLHLEQLKEMRAGQAHIPRETINGRFLRIALLHNPKRTPNPEIIEFAANTVQQGPVFHAFPGLVETLNARFEEKTIKPR